eukprot:CAMPEP_0197035696 /NCGR_PEP_ID=MMETSP1384-20130603/13417_1 /TAXON_ID=29189 /ORGANISM="Ammonia sp." /LENGTH=555 /DNA_ID=CAMNT_0042465789 /DNA_START=27 /DNA_END=1694 /DNA_ORIENTATION=-
MSTDNVGQEETTRHRDESELWEHDSNLSDAETETMQSSTTNFDYSLEDAISYLGLGKFQWFVMCLAGMVWFSAAIQLMCTSILILNLKNSESTMTNYEEGIIASMPFLGEIFGAFLLSMFSDKYGRKKAILIAALSLSFFGTLSAISYDFYMLIVCRLLTGCAVGGSLTCLSLVTEFIPQKHRGEMTYLEVAFWSFGALYAIGIGWLIYYAGLDWRWYLASCAAPSWVSVIGTFFIPPSPRWLLNNGDYVQVKEVLHRMAYWNNVDIEILRGNLIEPAAVDENKKGSLKSMFNKQHIQTSLQVLVTTFSATCAYFGIALYQLAYFESADSSFSDVFWELLVCTSSEIPGMILGIIIFDHIGRIPFLTSTFLVSMICFIGLVFSPEYVGVALIFLARMCVSTSYNILIVYILEYYPTTIRSTALGFCITLARFAGISTSFITQDLSTSSSSIIFAVCCAIATLCTFLLPVETLGRELTDESDEGIEDLVSMALTEYDQSTIPLMKHQPNTAIKKHLATFTPQYRHYDPHLDDQDTEETELCRAVNENVLPSQSAFF